MRSSDKSAKLLVYVRLSETAFERGISRRVPLDDFIDHVVAKEGRRKNALNMTISEMHRTQQLLSLK